MNTGSSGSRIAKANLLLAFLFAAIPAALGEIPELTVRVQADLSAAAMEARGRLRIFDDNLTKRLSGATNVRIEGRELVPVDEGRPMRFEVRLHSTARGRRIERRFENVRVLDWRDWLPLPVVVSKDEAAVIRVEGARVALPFEPGNADAATSRYLVRNLMLDHGGTSVIGDVDIERVQLPGFTISVASLGTGGADYRRWVEVVARAAIGTHGAVPGRHALVLVVPVEARRSAVPWAHVRRGGGNHIIAYVNREADADALLADWTLYHEFAHLFHPFLRGHDRWLSEGIASYLQYVYQARARTISTERAVERLFAGLERGRRENVADGGVRVERGGRMRTYWTGAALALEIDASLTDSSRDRRFARLMGEFAARELPAARSWSAEEYMAALAELEASDALLVRFRAVANSREFPDPGIESAAAARLLSGD